LRAQVAVADLTLGIPQDECFGLCPSPLGALNLSVSHSKSVFGGSFIWTRRVLNSQKRRFPARAVGPNGAGKTTALRMLSGDEPPTCGSITIDGRSAIEELAAVHQSTASCPQEGGLWEHLTARQHFTLYAAVLGLAPTGAAAQVGFGRIAALYYRSSAAY
jgi:ABC-type Fe3+/spermidine/putrescine transport system ATPase subunit